MQNKVFLLEYQTFLSAIKVNFYPSKILIPVADGYESDYPLLVVWPHETNQHIQTFVSFY